MLESLNKDFPEVLKDSVVQMYIKRCTEICWLMAVQDPPMALSTFEDEGNTFRRSKFREYTRTGALVDYAVWPAVLIQDNGDLMAKGVAQCCDKRFDNELSNKSDDERSSIPAHMDMTEKQENEKASYEYIALCHEIEKPSTMDVFKHQKKVAELDVEDNGDLNAKRLVRCYDNHFDNEILDKAVDKRDSIPALVGMSEKQENETVSHEDVALLHDEVGVSITKEVLEPQNKVTETDVEDKLTGSPQLTLTDLEETDVLIDDKMTMKLEDENLSQENITPKENDNEMISNIVPTDSNTNNQTRTNHMDE